MLLFVALWIFYIASVEVLASTQQTRILRKIGGYERMLTRVAPESSKLSLSHGSLFILKGKVSDELLLKSLQLLLKRHEVLNSFPSQDNSEWLISETAAESFPRKILSTVETDKFEVSCENSYIRSLNEAEFESNGPQWRFENIVSRNSPKSAWVFTFNHALDDQQSVNNIVSDLFYYINNSNNKNPEILALSKTRDQQSRDSSFPQRVGLLTDHIPPLPSIETVIAPERPNFRTAKWSAYQVMNMLSNALIIPKHVQNVISTAEDKKNTIYTDPNTRKTFTRRFIINKETFTKFRLVCRKNGVSITHALSAIESILTASLIDGHFLGKVSVSKDESTTSQNQIKLRFLLSVSLRPFASPSYITSVLGDLSTTTEMIPSSSPLSSLSVSRDWASGAVACAAGALDYIISVPSSNLHQMIVTQDTTQKGKSDSAIETFWNLAKTCSDTTDRLINKEKFVPESVRLFGIGMNIPGLDILKAVEVEANSYTSLGRGFSCGVSNAGIGTFPSVRVPADVASDIESELSVEEVYFGTSHGRNGVLSLLSCLTVNEQLCGCLQFTAPLTTPQEADCLLEALIRLIDRLS